MTPADREQDARAYIKYILSMESWGHGPVQVAEAIRDALDGKGLPEDAKAWLDERARR